MKRIKKETIYYIYVPLISVIISFLCNFLQDGFTEYYKKRAEETTQLLDLAKSYYEQNDIEAMVSVYSDTRLKNNAYANLNIGVLYAKGVYFKKDINIAIKYFYDALDNKEYYYSILYLLSALPYNTDEEKAEILRLVKIGCEHNNLYCEKILQTLYKKAGLEPVDSYLLDFDRKGNTEQTRILSYINVKVGSHDYRVATEYNYTVWSDDEGNMNVDAVATKVEDRSIPLEIKCILEPYEIVFGVGGI